jgi:uncharacterized protein (TIGR02145 family)
MKKMMLLMLTLFFLSAASMNAQVTIGSAETPHSGAVLDLQSTTQGLRLPNVALDDDLTQFVLPLEGISTKENAVGMLVYNTNPTFSVGVYIWTGKAWKPLTPLGRPGPDLIVGENKYTTYIYPGNVGTWMTDDSKEGTPDCEYYDVAVPALGSYYSTENAPSACPTGWHLPTDADWLSLRDYLADQAAPQEKYEFLNPNKFSGMKSADCKMGQNYREVGWYRIAGGLSHANADPNRIILDKNVAGDWYSTNNFPVRCKKD